ncbi:MAG: hypothetical protein ACFB4I_01775 [Cyanophyceae cyanobacterium]
MKPYSSFSRYLVARRAVVQSDIGETTPVKQPFSLSAQGDLVMFIPFLIAIGISLVAWASHLITVRQQVTRRKRAQRLPCGNCRYFHNQAYLYCAVQPTKVLQEEAKYCPDYNPQGSASNCVKQAQYPHQADQQQARHSYPVCYIGPTDPAPDKVKPVGKQHTT